MSQKINPKSLRTNRFQNIYFFNLTNKAFFFKKAISYSYYLHNFLTKSSQFKKTKGPSSRRRKKNNFYSTNFKHLIVGNKNFIIPFTHIFPKNFKK